MESQPPAVPSEKKDLLFETIKNSFDLFHTENRTAYANRFVGEIKQTFPVRGREFRQIVHKTLYALTGKSQLKDLVTNMIELLEIEALEARQDKVFIRVALHGDAIYIDLCNQAGEQVKITSLGVEIISSAQSPVNFIKTPRLKELPRPVNGGSLDRLLNYIHLESWDDYVLVTAWLVMVFNPNGPYPILVVQGEQGSGKTICCKFLRDLTDPAFPSIESFPRSERNFLVMAANGHVVSLDNISTISARWSDIFCRASTGGGRSERALYANGEVFGIEVKRPIILNCITDPITRPDAGDRSLAIKTATIPADKRIPEEELWRQWEADKPAMFGALCNAVSMAMRNMPFVHLDSYPRMADFAKFIVAAEPALPWESGTFLKAYENNRIGIIDNAIDADPVASAVVKLCQAYGAWTSTPSDLLSTLGQYVSLDIRRLNIWPKTANSLSGQLKRCATFLRAQNIEISFGKSQGQRYIAICPTVQPPLPIPAPLQPQNYE